MIAAGLVSALLWPSAPAVADVDRSQDLRELRDAIEQSRERVGSFEREERAHLERLEEIDVSLGRLRRQLAAARQSASEARSRLTRAETDRAQAETRLEATRRAMRRRVVALYKAGEIGPVRALFAAGSLRDLLSRVSSLRTLVASDAQLVQRFRSESVLREAAHREALVAAEERDTALASIAQQSAAQARERAARRQVVARVRADRGQERALLVELERAARALEETLQTLGDADGRRDGLDGSGFAERRGALDAPVSAPLLERFGRIVDAEFRTETFRKGVEFGAERGDPVRAVASAQVRFADWFRGYGQIVILDHGDAYFTVYGHLDEIAVEVGDAVDTGDTLGNAGDTGSLAGPRLYFEIRRGSEPLDPVEWLRRSAGS